MGVAVWEPDILETDVLRAPLSVVVRVVDAPRYQPREEMREVLEQAAFVWSEPDAAGRVSRVDARDPVHDPLARTACWTSSLMSRAEKAPAVRRHPSA
jgi:hypothetical protein